MTERSSLWMVPPSGLTGTPTQVSVKAVKTIDSAKPWRYTLASANGPHHRYVINS